MRRALLTAIFLPALAWAAESPFTGTWKVGIGTMGLVLTFEGTAEGLMMSAATVTVPRTPWATGESYDAKFDGKDYAVKGDPGGSVVSLKKVDDRTIVETRRRGGRIVSITTLTVSADGESLTATIEDKERGKTPTWRLARQSSTGSRTPAPGRHDECVVHYIDDAQKAELDADFQPFELGRFLTDAGGEGSFVLKRFELPTTGLFVFASVLYEDDLLYEEALHDAITFKLSVTASPSEQPETHDWVAFSMNQIPHGGFRVWDAGLSFLHGKKSSAVLMRCEASRLGSKRPEI